MVEKIIVVIATGVVAAVFLAGITVMAIGGKTAEKWSNVLMRYRIVTQAVALLIIAAIVYFSASG